MPIEIQSQSSKVKLGSELVILDNQILTRQKSQNERAIQLD
jgi:hypothetical protein